MTPVACLPPDRFSFLAMARLQLNPVGMRQTAVRPNMKPTHALLATFLLFTFLSASASELIVPPPPESTGPAKLTFSLLPKSFQKNPAVDFNVITEMTSEGKKAPKPTERQPIYYIAQPGQYTQLGLEHIANEKPPPVADLERAMQKALASSGYLPSADAGHKPRLVVVFNYGSFGRFSNDFDEFEEEVAADEAYQQASVGASADSAPTAPQVPIRRAVTADELLPYVLADAEKRRDVIERAALVAGAKFARELAEAIAKEVDYRLARSGVGAPEEDPASPFNRFRNDNEKLMYFVQESFSSCYFVIASAYDYTAMSKGNRLLLWRTKMTVNSLGISMTESLPSLIVSAGPYLGREMGEAAIISKQISREGHVRIGTPTVVDDSAKSPTNAPAVPKKTEPAKP